VARGDAVGDEPRERRVVEGQTELTVANVGRRRADGQNG